MDFRFGELRERSLHRDLKALYRPADGEEEVALAGGIADLWSPSQGVIEIQTRSLGKLVPRVRRYLSAGWPVTVVFPIAAVKTIVRWSADGTQCLSRRKSPKRATVEGSFREIGALWPVLLEPHFRLRVVLTNEEEHRRDDGQGSWRLRGQTRVDRQLIAVLGVREFASRDDFATLIPSDWGLPATTTELADVLKMPRPAVQPFVSCLKKLGILEVCGRAGRSDLLRRCQ